MGASLHRPPARGRAPAGRERKSGLADPDPRRRGGAAAAGAGPPARIPGRRGPPRIQRYFITSACGITRVKLERCAYCGDDTDLPFECSYCRDPFCAEHRLPEDHRCVRLTQIRASRFGERKVVRDGGRDRPSLLRRVFGRFKG